MPRQVRPFRTPQSTTVKRLAYATLLTLAVAIGTHLPLPGRTAHAQTGDYSLLISPLLIELTATPGSTQFFDVYVLNQSPTKMATFDVRVVSVNQTPNGGYTFSDDLRAPYSAAEWISLSADQVTLAPGQSATIFGQVTVPRDQYGGRYAAVVLELQPEERTDPEANAAAIFRYRLGSVIELTVGNRFQRRAHVADLGLMTGEQIPALAAQFGRNALLFYAELANESNIHVFGRGTLYIRNAEGRRVRQIPLGQGRGAVLPDARLRFSSILPAGLPPGTYTMQAVINYGGLRPAIAQREFTIAGPDLVTGSFHGGPSLQFAVEPAQLELTIPAGARRVESISVHNLESVPIRITGRAQPLIYDDQGELDVIAMDEAAGAIDWVQVLPDEVVLNPGQRRNLRVIVQNHTEQPGGRYAYLALHAVQIDPASREAAEGGLTGDLGTEVALTSADGHVLDASIDEVRITPATELAPFTIEISIVNTGNIHFIGSGTLTLERAVEVETPEGVVFIGDTTFETVWQGPLPNDVLRKVLPGERRQISGTIAQPLEPGHYRLSVALNQGTRPLDFAQKEFIIAPPSDEPQTEG